MNILFSEVVMISCVDCDSSSARLMGRLCLTSDQTIVRSDGRKGEESSERPKFSTMRARPLINFCVDIVTDLDRMIVNICK